MFYWPYHSPQSHQWDIWCFTGPITHPNPVSGIPSVLLVLSLTPIPSVGYLVFYWPYHSPQSSQWDIWCFTGLIAHPNPVSGISGVLLALSLTPIQSVGYLVFCWPYHSPQSGQCDIWCFAGLITHHAHTNPVFCWPYHSHQYGVLLALSLTLIWCFAGLITHPNSVSGIPSVLLALTLTPIPSVGYLVFCWPWSCLMWLSHWDRSRLFCLSVLDPHSNCRSEEWSFPVPSASSLLLALPVK